MILIGQSKCNLKYKNRQFLKVTGNVTVKIVYNMCGCGVYRICCSIVTRVDLKTRVIVRSIMADLELE